jgi:hypothetical protein
MNIIVLRNTRCLVNQKLLEHKYYSLHNLLDALRYIIGV